MQKGVLLLFQDTAGNTVLERRITALTIREECIIEKSIEFFSDPEPCMIHRSAVMKRIFAETEDFFMQNFQKGCTKLLWNAISEDFYRNFHIDGQINCVIIKLF